MTINWNNIRLHQGAQDQGFEELCSQLFRHEPPPSNIGFERRGYRDAGLECAHILRDGSLWGMQAKFFTRAPSKDEWGQVDKSVKDALAKNPRLRHLTICIPQNFDDPKISGQTSAMDQWKAHKQKWEKIASDNGQQVDFELWGDSELVDRLTRLENRGKLWYFFNQDVLTPEWFAHRVDDVAKNAGVRYSDELNVDLPISQLFEGLGRTERFAHLPREQQGELNRLLSHRPVQDLPEKAGLVVQEVEHLITTLRDTLEEVDYCGTTQLPLTKVAELSDKLRDAAHKGRGVLEVAASEKENKARAEWESAGKQGHFYFQSPYSDLRQSLWEVASAAHELYEFAEGKQAHLANERVLFITGSAGKGKTHLLIDVAKGRTANGLPTLIVLGENFRAGVDPLTQIIEMVGLKQEHEIFLQALETAAEASEGHFLLLMDALNEGEGKELWPKQLSGLLNMLRRYPRIGVAFSVRTTYEDVILPDTIREKTIKEEHEGFASRPEAAVRAFFTFYGLNLPRIPLLNPEFTNPLFLKLLCQGLQKEGMHELPEGYEGITHVFAFLIEATDRKLRREGKIDVGPYEQPVREYLNRMADALAGSGEDVFLLKDADRIGREILPSTGYQRSLLNLLLMEGILSREMLPEQGKGSRQEGVRFAYQRLGDHEVVRRLLDLHCQEDSEAAFRPEGAIGRLFNENYHFYRYKGWLEAFAIQIPERFGKEITDYLPPSEDRNVKWVRNRVLSECLVESLLWRRKETITGTTFAALEAIDLDGSLYDRYLEVLITLASIPDHPLNAERLHGILSRYSLPERDAFWTQWLYQHHEDGATDRLITWGLLSEKKTHLSDEAVLLASVAIAWFTVSTVRTVRDRATKALVRLLTPRPHLVASLLDRFSRVDDLYVTERLYAAAYGVAMRLSDREALCALAETIYQRLFAIRPVLAHIMIRDYGRCVIERASESGCSLTFNIQSVRPPYDSDLPLEPPTSTYFENLVNPDGEWTDRDRAISHVVNRFGMFDHSEYFGGPSFRHPTFTSIPLSEAVPPSRREVQAAWEESLTPAQLALWEQAQRLRFANVRFSYSVLSDEESDVSEQTQDDEEQASTEIIVESASEFDDVIAELETSLTPAQQDILQSTLLTPYAASENQLPTLPDNLFARSVIQRALELGWTAERFAFVDSMVERGKQARGEHPVDTIGAKYLWIAYYEIYARLADNYHVLKSYSQEEAAPFVGPWHHNLRTIDPSLVPNEHGEKEDREWWWPGNYHLDDVRERHGDWLRRTDDLPSIANFLIVRDRNGVEWVTLEFYPNWNQSEKPEEPRHNRIYRNLWLQLRGYLVKREDIIALSAWMQAQDFMGRWMPEGGEYHELFLGELYTSVAWRSITEDPSWGSQDWHQPRRDCPALLAHIQEEYAQPDGDKAPIASIRIMLPSHLLAREADLRWSGENGEWLNSNGEIVVQDPSVRDGGRGTLLIRRDFLDRFLDTQGYELVWTVLGEKLVINWDGHYPRLNITGFGHYTTTQPRLDVTTEYSGTENA